MFYCTFFQASEHKTFNLNGIWIRALPGPKHLGLKTGPLYPMFCTKLEEPCFLSKVPDGPILSFLISSGSKKEGTQTWVSEWSRGLTLTENMDSDFLLSTTFPKDGVITQFHYTGCNRRNGPDFGRVFLTSNYTNITQNTYIQSWTVTEILAREKSGLLWCLRTVLVGDIILPPTWTKFLCYR